jgi:uncharacterized protein (DUF302 family)
MSQDNVITLPSKHDVSVTLDRLASLAVSKGMQVFARIDHTRNAEEVGMALRPTQLLVFGNAKGGTPLMQDRQAIGLDLPLRALAWQDDAGRVWLSYHPASTIAAQHGLRAASASAVQAIDKGLALLCGLAAAEDKAGPG